MTNLISAVNSQADDCRRLSGSSGGRQSEFSDTESTCSTSSQESHSRHRQKKHKQLTRLISERCRDLATYRHLAISNNGLVCDSIRRHVWLLLAGCTEVSTPNLRSIYQRACKEVAESHSSYRQVQLDAERSLKRFPPGMDDEQRKVLIKQLINVVVAVLLRHPQLNYYQGFHDVCLTFLLVCGEERAFNIMDRLSMTVFRDFLRETFDKTKHMLFYVYAIIEQENRPLVEHMARAEIGAIFCLSWVITWFSHVLSNFRDTVRLFDILLSYESSYLPIYVSASLVLSYADEIMLCEPDMAEMHHLLSSLVERPVDIEQVAARAAAAFESLPPGRLDAAAAKWRDRFSLRLDRTLVRPALPGRRRFLFDLIQLLPHYFFDSFVRNNLPNPPPPHANAVAMRRSASDDWQRWSARADSRQPAARGLLIFSVLTASAAMYALAYYRQYYGPY